LDCGLGERARSARANFKFISAGGAESIISAFLFADFAADGKLKILLPPGYQEYPDWPGGR